MKNMIHEKDISDALLSFIKTKQIQLIDVRWFGGEPTLKLDYIISLSKKWILNRLAGAVPRLQRLKSTNR